MYYVFDEFQVRKSSSKALVFFVDVRHMILTYRRAGFSVVGNVSVRKIDVMRSLLYSIKLDKNKYKSKSLYRGTPTP